MIFHFILGLNQESRGDLNTDPEILQKYMNYLNISAPDDLLIHPENPKIIQDQIIEYLIQLKNPPNSLRYATRSQYLAAIMTFYELNDAPLNKKKIYRYLGEEERPIENRGQSYFH